MLNVSTAKAFDFASEFKIPPDFRIIENSKTIYNGNWSACPLNHIIRIQIQIMTVRYSKNDCLHPIKGFFQIFLDFNLIESILTPEKAFP